MEVGKVFENIHGAAKGDFGAGILYAGAVGLILSDIIPTPADAFYFYREKQLRDKWKAGKITPEKYWQKIATAYYIYNPIWWSLVLVLLYTTKGDIPQKAKIGLAVIGIGAVVGMLYRNKKKDIVEIQKIENIEEPEEQFTGPQKKAPKQKLAIREGNRLKFV